MVTHQITDMICMASWHGWSYYIDHASGSVYLDWSAAPTTKYITPTMHFSNPCDYFMDPFHSSNIFDVNTIKLVFQCSYKIETVARTENEQNIK